MSLGSGGLALRWPARRQWVARRWRRLAGRGDWLLPGLLAGGTLIVVVVVGALVGAVHALRVEHRLQGLNQTVRVVEADIQGRQIGAARAQLTHLQGELGAVNSSLYDSPDFRLLAVLPVARQNLEAVRSSVHLALTVIGGGQRLIDATSPLQTPDGRLNLSFRRGQLPTAAMKTVAAAAQAVADTLPSSPRPPGGSLVLGRVRSGQDKVWSEAVRSRSALSSLAQLLQVANEVSGGNGPRKYLIAVANPAEMRGAGGMILNYGVLKGNDGRISLGRFGSTVDLMLKKPARENFPADFLRQFGGLKPNQYFQEATIMSDFTVDAPVIESMFAQATGQRVDGVIQVDPYVLAAILAGTGPVANPVGGLITAANVVPFTLNTAYLEFPQRSERKSFLSDVAHETFDHLTTSHNLDLRSLARALGIVAKTRHLLMYSNDRAIQGSIHGLHVAGGLPGPGNDFAQLTVQNFGADKLDFYLLSGLAITGTRPSNGHAGRVTATIALQNTSPASSQSQYVFGPGPNKGYPPGEYLGQVVLFLPPGTRLLSARGAFSAGPPSVGSANGVRTVTFPVYVPAKTGSVLTLHLDLPPRTPGPEHFEIVPTPRVHPTAAIVKLTS